MDEVSPEEIVEAIMGIPVKKIEYDASKLCDPSVN